MTNKLKIAGAIGSAAIAAALLYAGKRSSDKTTTNKPKRPAPIPSGENPETD